MKYYNTSLGNCAAPSSGVYQVSNTLIRKPPLFRPVPRHRQESYATSFPSPRVSHVAVCATPLPPAVKISSCDEEKNYRDVCKGKGGWRARRGIALWLGILLNLYISRYHKTERVAESKGRIDIRCRYNIDKETLRPSVVLPISLVFRFFFASTNNFFRAATRIRSIAYQTASTFSPPVFLSR